MRSKLTTEDVEWLEHRLSAAMVPVMPRAAFVHDAKEALLNGSSDADELTDPSYLPVISAVLLAIATVLLIATIVRRRRKTSQVVGNTPGVSERREVYGLPNRRLAARTEVRT